DKMVKQGNSYDFHCPQNSFRKIQIRPAGLWIPAGMVMYQNDPLRVLRKGGEKNFPWICKRAIYCSLKNHFFSQQMIFCVKHHTYQHFLLFMTKLFHIIICYSSGTVVGKFSFRCCSGNALGKFTDTFYLYCLHCTHALYASKLGKT